MKISYEKSRGCGYRKEGGLYLVSGGLLDSCFKLPIPLTVCPCCHAGIKPSRGWTWIGKKLIEDAPCSKTGCKGCVPFDGSVDRFGLIWVGEKFYKTPYDFNKEALTQGISRRIKAVPKDFVIGETWVLLAHRKCIGAAFDSNPKDDEEAFTPGIFCAFKPTAIEYVVKDDDDPDYLAGLEKRGITLVKVFKEEERQQSMFNQ